MHYYTATFEQPARGGLLNLMGLTVPGRIGVLVKQRGRRGWKAYLEHNNREIATPASVSHEGQLAQVEELFDRQIGEWVKHSTINHLAGSGDAGRAACGSEYDPSCETAPEPIEPTCYDCMVIWKNRRRELKKAS